MSLRPREVILVRHANADWPTYSGRDFDRPLTPQGLLDAQASAAAIQAAAQLPVLLIASPARRTAQTAEIIAAALALPAPAISFVESLYNAAPMVLDAELRRAFRDNPRVILVGHNPGISELARNLTGNSILAPLRPAQWMQFTVQPG